MTDDGNICSQYWTFFQPLIDVIIMSFPKHWDVIRSSHFLTYFHCEMCWEIKSKQVTECKSILHHMYCRLSLQRGCQAKKAKLCFQQYLKMHALVDSSVELVLMHKVILSVCLYVVHNLQPFLYLLDLYTVSSYLVCIFTGPNMFKSTLTTLWHWPDPVMFYRHNLFVVFLVSFFRFFFRVSIQIGLYYKQFYCSYKQ